MADPELDEIIACAIPAARIHDHFERESLHRGDDEATCDIGDLIRKVRWNEDPAYAEHVRRKEEIDAMARHVQGPSVTDVVAAALPGLPVNDPSTYSAPFDVLGMGGRSQGWIALNMHEIRFYQEFARKSGIIQAVCSLCLDGLRSTDILIETEDERTKREGSSGGGGKPVDAEAEIRRSQRSQIFGKWAHQVEMMIKDIGFAVCCCVPNKARDGSAEANPIRPIVLELGRVQIYVKVDVFAQHEWIFVDIDRRKRIPNVLVFGDHLPDMYGQIMSKVKRIAQSEWRLYSHKLQTTISADLKSSHLTVVTQLHNEPHNPLSVTGSANPLLNTLSPNTLAGSGPNDPCAPKESGGGGGGNKNQDIAGLPSTDETGKVIYSRAVFNSAATNAGTNYSLNRTTLQQRRNPNGQYEQIRIEAGREYAHSNPPKAPDDLLPSRQAFYESVSLEFGVPLMMISAGGDTSGRAKLNTATASAEIARVFRNAIASRKKQVEAYIREMYQFMYQEWNVERAIEKRVGKEVSDRKRKREQSERGDSNKKRKQDAAATNNESEEDDDEDVDSLSGKDEDDDDTNMEDEEHRELDKHARVYVTVTSDPDFAMAMEIYKMGNLKVDAYNQMAANYLTVGIDAMNAKPKPPQVEPKDETALEVAELGAETQEKTAKLQAKTTKETAKLTSDTTKETAKLSAKTTKETAELSAKTTKETAQMKAKEASKSSSSTKKKKSKSS